MTHPPPSGPVMLAELTVKPGMMTAFLDYTIANLAVSRSFPGNVRFDILVSDANPQTVFFYEVWESAAAQQAYMAWRVHRGDLTTLMAMLACEPRFMALRPPSPPAADAEPA